MYLIYFVVADGLLDLSKVLADSSLMFCTFRTEVEDSTSRYYWYVLGLAHATLRRLHFEF